MSAAPGGAPNPGTPDAGGGALPTFLIIGAAKCGTTSLHRYLGLHPEIFVPLRKELKLFSREDWADHLDWYREHFPAEAPVRGESSPTYSVHPWIPGVPERIHSLIPEAKLIYLVRDPVDRFVAHYVEERVLGLEHRSLPEVISDMDPERNRGLMAGRYAFQLERFRSCFPEQQILVVDQWELMNERPAALREVFEFLGVDASFWTPEFDELHNRRASKVVLNRFGRWLQGRGSLASARSSTRRLLPDALRERAKRLVGRRADPPALSNEDHRELQTYFSAEVERLRRDTGKSFSHWNV